MSGRLDEAMRRAAGETGGVLASLSPRGDGPEKRLFAAMAYALNGGKRLRAFLVLSANALFGGDRQQALRVAAATEMIHTYSLAHDDLPAMDDDDMRRGRPSCHKRYGEAAAILAGDALLTLAFEILASPLTHEDAARRCRLVSELAKRAGARGMVGGQMFDLEASRSRLLESDIARLQKMKTGALLGFAVCGGALLNNPSDDQLASLDAYAADLGLAFQIADDLLDATASADQLGKAAGKDADAGKATFVSLLGVDEARRRAHQLALSAVARLDGFDERADRLRDVARFVVQRDH